MTEPKIRASLSLFWAVDHISPRRDRPTRPPARQETSPHGICSCLSSSRDACALGYRQLSARRGRFPAPIRRDLPSSLPRSCAPTPRDSGLLPPRGSGLRERGRKVRFRRSFIPRMPETYQRETAQVRRSEAETPRSPIRQTPRKRSGAQTPPASPNWPLIPSRVPHPQTCLQPNPPWTQDFLSAASLSVISESSSPGANSAPVVPQIDRRALVFRALTPASLSQIHEWQGCIGLVGGDVGSPGGPSARRARLHLGCGRPRGGDGHVLPGHLHETGGPSHATHEGMPGPNSPVHFRSIILLPSRYSTYSTPLSLPAWLPVLEPQIDSWQ